MSKDAAAAIIELYQGHSSAWIDLRDKTLFEQPWLDKFLSVAAKGGRQVLDLGCGSGQPIAEYLIAKGFNVTGVDGAGALTEAARENFSDHTWITADMRNLPPLGRFHGLIAWNSSFHLTPEDQRSMFETFNHLCYTGAALMFTSGTALGEAIGTFEGQPLYHGSLAPTEYRSLLQANGFELLEHVEEDPTCGGVTIWLAQKKWT